MSRIIEQDGKRYFLDGYNFYELPDARRKNSAFFKGREFYYSDRIDEFLNSAEETCVVPVYCDSASEKRAFKIVTLKTKTEEYRFTSSEKGQYSYYRNEVKEMEQGKVYLIFLERFKRARNDCLIKRTVEIQKSLKTAKIDSQEPPCDCFIVENVEEMLKELDKIYDT